MAQNVDFSEFQPLSLEAWEARALKDLKGKALDSIDWEYSSGLNARAYADRTHLPPHIGLPTDSTRQGWRIAERFVLEDSTTANTEIMEALQEGCNELVLVKAPSFTGDVEEVLGGVFRDMVTIVLEDQMEQRAHFRSEPGQGYAEQLSGLLDRTANYLESADRIHDDLVIRWDLRLGTAFFPELAKVRAARLLLHRMLELSCADTGLPAFEVCIQNAEWPEDEDDYNNLLRGTTIAMAGAAGGADSILISPFTTNKEKLAFGRRLARNIQHILKEESFFDQISDPAAGSYYIESMTEQLCEEAWGLFKNNRAS